MEFNKTVAILRSKAVYANPRVDKCAKSLSQEGWRVNILAWDRGTLEDIPRRELRDGYEIFRLKLKSVPGKIEEVFKMIIFNFFLIIYLISNRPKVIHSCDLETLIPALFSKALYGAKIIYDICDFFSYKFAISYNNSYAINILTRLEMLLLNFADIVLVADEGLFGKLKFNNKFIRLYNSPEDLSFLSFNNNSKFKIFYAGEFSVGRGLEKIIHVIKGMNDVEFYLAGYKGLLLEEIIRLASHSDNVIYLGALRYNSVLKIASTCDILIALNDPSILKYKISSPNKIFESMMLGKPIIVSKETSMAELVHTEECGIIVDYNKIDDLKKAIKCLKDDLNYRNKLGLNGRKSYCEKYSWNIMKKRLLFAYNYVKDK
jgi:glycosyltransferase involved in cell wall biosynthesis